MPQMTTPYELWSTSPPEWPSSSSSDKDSEDDNIDHTEHPLMSTQCPQNKVGMGEGEWETKGEGEMRGGMEEGLPGPFSSAVTKQSDPSPDLESGCW